jgi:hypothetical protein
MVERFHQISSNVAFEDVLEASPLGDASEFFLVFR